jgi:hypothetical protein
MAQGYEGYSARLTVGGIDLGLVARYDVTVTPLVDKNGKVSGMTTTVTAVAAVLPRVGG